MAVIRIYGENGMVCRNDIMHSLLARPTLQISKGRRRAFHYMLVIVDSGFCLFGKA